MGPMVWRSASDSIKRLMAVPLMAAGLSGAAYAVPVDAPDLQQAIRQAFSTRLGKQGPAAPAARDDVIEPIKSDQEAGWVFGTVTQVVPNDSPAYPVSKLFVAQRAKDGWVVGIEGTDAFYALAAAAPAKLLPRDERAHLNAGRAPATSRPSAAAGQTGLALPWQQGAAWYWTGGAHGWSGESRPFNSLDFSIGNGQVLAARGGVLYKSCERNGSAIVKVVHDNGYATTYYHMVQLTQAGSGTRVRQGEYLGRVGNGLPCGGQTTGPHVHFALSQGGSDVPVNGKTIGGWQFFEGGGAYSGYAIRNQRRVSVQASLTNYGSEDSGGPAEPSPSVKATVQAPGPVNLRSAPSLSASVVGTVANGATVQLACYAYGDTVRGNWGATRLWYRLGSNQWVSDGFVHTGSNDPVVSACTSR
ncbi:MULTISPECIES: peptidoglycan DD-metalloendopeptidase family protein [Burkholderia]|uniref:LasA protease n=1 Tax=Burkholderia savannae TaxID=1637837 RepID=A0ABR5T7D9_9BURK|nr:MULTISPECIES: peptidoglycan DD-metalloendopeptidase family protein [Burkholderia]AOJ72014.1 LasA protease [Burkholderia savannae]KVG49722.1 LasA protease [Burkholderia sp. MSMB0265]KVG82897.1 LasA protease [Burkholderia sp. MSMB2040]KVG93510.1 LasA protease [Burkholderia sp. MSMB2041]KVG97937.1 LasA protease [Burkholderia sp. MSMB2042]